jgi:hypothetical protein
MEHEDVKAAGRDGLRLTDCADGREDDRELSRLRRVVSPLLLYRLPMLISCTGTPKWLMRRFTCSRTIGQIRAALRPHPESGN